MTHLQWLGPERFELGGTVFQVAAPDMLFPSESMEGADFFVMKERPHVEELAALVDRLRPERIVELGIFRGGSTALLCELARPRCLVAVDLEPVDARLREFAARPELAGALRLHEGVDQADRPRLAEITGAAFGDAPLDLVIDDCSHLYEPTRASFNELFPRLRPGGMFVIEDWRWAHATLDADNDGLWPDRVPLSRLVFEIVLALPSVPGLIADVAIDIGSVRVTRGDAAVGPAAFDVAECCRPRGRGMLARG
jgi:predicted O-methyltransferase YrrM